MMNGTEVIGILVSLTAISSYINYRYFKLPKTIGLTLITLILSLFIAGLGKIGFNVDDFASSLLDGIGFNNTFLHGMLGFLLFAASLHINAMELAKHKLIVGLLATVSVVLSTFIIGFCTFALTQFIHIDIPLEYCLVFGALISPTDPIATLSILKTAQAPKSLEMKIIGESLFNDGMGIVLFVMLLALAAGGGDWSLSVASLFFLQQGIGGLLLGLVMGWAAARLLRSIDSFEVATILTLAVVTGGYTFAESIVHVSGAICMAVAGLMVGSLLQNGNMSKKTLQRLDTFWKLLDGLLNAVLFVVIGLEFLKLNFSLPTLFASIGAIIICIAARWISVVVPVGWLAIFRKYNPNVVLVMTWGGLRGGISIALALTVPEPARDFILSITYAVVLFSITVQGLTLKSLVRYISRYSRYQEDNLNLELIPLNTLNTRNTLEDIHIDQGEPLSAQELNPIKAMSQPLTYTSSSTHFLPKVPQPHTYFEKLEDPLVINQPFKTRTRPIGPLIGRVTGSLNITSLDKYQSGRGHAPYP